MALVPILCQQQLALRGDECIGWQRSGVCPENARTANLAARGTRDGCLSQRQVLATAAGRESEACLVGANVNTGQCLN